VKSKSRIKFWQLPLKFSLLGLLSSCSCANSTVPLHPTFQAERYLGRWYEIARLPHRFEEGLSNITAEYTAKGQGLKVVNRGYDEQRHEWRSITGSAYFTQAPNIPELRVTFFRPFYGCYRVIALDEQNYEYALVSGKDYSYLWLLARAPSLPAKIQESLVQRAKEMGFDTERLIYVKHDLNQ